MISKGIGQTPCWFLAGKGLQLLLTGLGVSLITFILMHLAPGDAAEIWLRNLPGMPAEATLQSAREQLGLQKPWIEQYIIWLANSVRFNLGISFRTGEPVTQEILQRLPATLELATGAFLFMVCVSLLLGTGGTLFARRWPDQVIRVWTVAVTSLPGYWLGLLLIFFFAVKLHLLPSMGRGGILHLILPAITLGLGLSAVSSQVVRATMMEVLSQDYIKLARAKGLSTWQVLTRHVLINALPPLVTTWGLSLGHLLGGSAIVETIFSWPGLGSLLIESISQRDYPVTMGCVVFLTIIFVSINFLVDIIHGCLDPRVRKESGNYAPQ